MSIPCSLVRVRLVLILALLALVGGCKPDTATAQESDGFPSLRLVPVAEGLSSPTAIVSAEDGSGRLFVLEQPGRIRIIADGELLAEPFLDISNAISSGGEQGLLGLAFHPSYRETGEFFVDYTDTNGDTVVARYQVSPEDPDRARPQSEQEVLRVEQPYANHNGGQLAFGPDGYLYVALGDGGAAGDPLNNGQNLATLLGSLLRIDVDGATPYGIPEDNPFVGRTDARPEIWAYGLRNPWRFSFDRETGDLWIADVGQRTWEEVNLQPADSTGGENYGWRIMEGAHCFEDPNCNREVLVDPIIEYDHGQGCSVTGGYRYRGDSIPALAGVYLFSDYCNGEIRGATRAEDGTWTVSRLLTTGMRVSAFGEDESGELYVADYESGALYRLEAEQ